MFLKVARFLSDVLKLVQPIIQEYQRIDIQPDTPLLAPEETEEESEEEHEEEHEEEVEAPRRRRRRRRSYY